jgi:hypothetical protein
MEKNQWLKEYDGHYPKFEWFILKYFGTECTDILKKLMSEEKHLILFSILSDIWFRLPDHIFNILENPKGWNEFLGLLEDPPIDDVMGKIGNYLN